MEINNTLIKKVLDIDCDVNIQNSVLGFPFQNMENMLSFLDTEKFIPSIIEHEKITAIFTTEAIANKIKKSSLKIIKCDDPRLAFYTLFNHMEKAAYQKTKSLISTNSDIHRTAFVSDYNVSIGENVIIEPNVTIMPDVIIGDNCIVRAGATIGTEGFEHKRTSKGILPVFHSGKVILENNVEVGANNTISKGHFGIDTRLGENTKLDNLVHIAHSVQVGKNCFITASVMIAGTTKIGDSVWIGPGSRISSQITIGDNAFITIGSVVTKNVVPGEWVTGNFAIPHSIFLEDLKNKLKK